MPELKITSTLFGDVVFHFDLTKDCHLESVELSCGRITEVLVDGRAVYKHVHVAGSPLKSRVRLKTRAYRRQRVTVRAVSITLGSTTCTLTTR